MDEEAFSMNAGELIERVISEGDPYSAASALARKFSTKPKRTVNIDGDAAWTVYLSQSQFDQAYKMARRYGTPKDGFSPDTEGRYGVSFWID